MDSPKTKRIKQISEIFTFNFDEEKDSDLYALYSPFTLLLANPDTPENIIHNLSHGSFSKGKKYKVIIEEIEDEKP